MHEKRMEGNKKEEGENEKIGRKKGRKEENDHLSSFLCLGRKEERKGKGRKGKKGTQYSKIAKKRGKKTGRRGEAKEARMTSYELEIEEWRYIDSRINVWIFRKKDKWMNRVKKCKRGLEN